MAGLAILGRLLVRPIISQKPSLFVPLSRKITKWNKDWKPGPYPETAAERAAAAKKYGLRVEDYEPYPNDGFGYGDYPKIADNPPDSRDPYEDWDIPDAKRNFGEPLHVHIDMMSEDKYNPDIEYKYSWSVMYGMLFGVVGTLIVLILLAEPYPHFQPVMKKQYPKDGVHYTFEVVE